MARFYAQICTVAFLIVVIGGFLVGDASHVVAGEAQGNVDGMQLHLTYGRDVLDVVLLAAFALVGFVTSRRIGRLVVGAAGVVLLALAIIGFAVGDTNAGSRSLIDLHFPLAINIFDLVVGVLGILAALGTVEDEGPTSVIRPAPATGGGEPSGSRSPARR
ncbi:MAG TPA: hypothetical protein VEK76_08535 [Candidatus Binatia bacterium]|nr:hypothetical protein [Candidatus Binatia bacterium]